jgi:hypothetical protein
MHLWKQATVKKNLLQKMCARSSFNLGLETAQNNNKIMRALSDVFKIERCGRSPLTSNRKNEFGKKLMISKQNRKRKVL